MKNILVLGNGFDLYYKLPTKYDNFLHVVDFLLRNSGRTFETIGDVFSQEELQNADNFIACCYNAHKKTFDDTPLRSEDISEIINLTKNNLWFSYLNKVLDKDVGWIDFEKEIGFALQCFQKIFEKSLYICFDADELDVKHVVELFGFYIDVVASRKVANIGTYKVNADYCTEKPIGSGKNIINTKKVVDKLYNELLDLAKALKLYLGCFIESTYELLKNDGTCIRLDFLSHIEKTITFNYTNTYENMYFNNSAFHIHGNVNDEIVLGVNPDEFDNLESVNTTFVYFKKYFQRTLFETDKDYLQWMRGRANTQSSYRLFVMGHSLDVTDCDIIAELIQNAKEVVVLYHSTDAKKSYISNLIKMFGKKELDALKKDKKLTFLSLDQDFSSLKKFLSEESWKDVRRNTRTEQGEKITII